MAEDKEVIVTGGEGGGGGGAMVAIIALVLLIAVGAFLFFGTNVFRGGSSDINADVKVEAPATK
jgi:hypothetical protein